MRFFKNKTVFIGVELSLLRAMMILAAKPSLLKTSSCFSFNVLVSSLDDGSLDLMYPIFLLRIRQKMLTSSTFLHQFFTFFAFFLQDLVQVSSSIIRFPLLSSKFVTFFNVVGESSDMETFVQKKIKPPTVSNLIEQAISQLDNHLFFLLGHKITFGTYVHLCIYISFSALQHQLSYIFHHSTNV